jgi:hypothetical protein
MQKTDVNTELAIFFIASAVIGGLATIGITAISSAAPAEAAREGFTANGHSHNSCSSGNGGCVGNDARTFNSADSHQNANCNTKRLENTGVFCKGNSH